MNDNISSFAGSAKIWARVLCLIIAVMIFAAGCDVGNSDQGTDNNTGNDESGQDITSPTDDANDNGDDNGGDINKEEEKRPVDILKESYAVKADWAQESLLKYFWNENAKFMNNTYPFDKDSGHLNYWWKAHAVDAMMDAYERTGDTKYTNLALQIVKGIIMRNGSLYNEFYDDMEWLALSALRLYDATGDETVKSIVLNLWNDIKNAWWEDDIGGMAWKKNDNNRNTCSNGPAAILAARLYDRFGNEEDLEYAKKIFAWLKANLVDPESGIAWDGMLVVDGKIENVNKSWIFTYGQGTYLGAGVELYKVTGDEQYLKDAEKTAAAAFDKLVSFSTGIMKDEGQGDGGLFKGILIRYLVNLYEINKDETIKKVIFKNTDSLMQTSFTDGMFGTSWDKRRPLPLDLTTELSGVFLIEGAAKIDRLDAGKESD